MLEKGVEHVLIGVPRGDGTNEMFGMRLTKIPTKVLEILF